MSLLARFEAAALRRHQRSVPWPSGSGAVTTRAKGATMTSEAPYSDPQPLTGDSGPELHPCDSEALTALTAEAEDSRAAYGFLEVEVAEQIAKVTERDEVIENWRAAHHRLWVECDSAITSLRDRNAEIARMAADLLAKDATIERLADEIKEAWLTIANLQTGLVDALATIARMRTGRP